MVALTKNYLLSYFRGTSILEFIKGFFVHFSTENLAGLIAFPKNDS